MLALAFATRLGAQSNGAVRGVVWDSLRARPLRGAIVQLASVATQSGVSAVADSNGTFEVRLPQGRYVIGFLHPFLDSIGIEAPVREIEIGSRPTTVTLASPSAARLHHAVCGAPTDAELSAIAIGTLRASPDGQPIENGKVSAIWSELTFAATGTSNRVVTREATTGPGGVFALCHLPRASMNVIAQTSADSTDLLEMSMPAGGFTTLDLYLGAVPAPATPTTPTARVSGMVVDNRGLGIADVRVVRDNVATYTDTRGRWTLRGLPYGTRTVAVRRLGYFPIDLMVAVGIDSTPIPTTLLRAAAMLDTMKVVARMDYAIAEREFDQRKRLTMGRFVSPEDIRRYKPYRLSDMFSRIGLQVKPSENGLPGMVEMRGPFGMCSPEFYLNGHLFGDSLTAADMDGFVNVKEIIGVEVHRLETVPAQYHTALKECGSILVWVRDY